MDHDDRPTGRILSRREVLVLLGASGAAALAACAPGQDATPTRNAEAETAEVLENNPTAMHATEGAAATVAAMQVAMPACVVRPESTEGPYFVDIELDRSDIRVEPSTGQAVAGVPVALAFHVAQIGSGACAALPGAVVDLWHCDAEGVYSGVAGSPDTKFLRGFQTTDANGVARFTTIFPGWYRGRTLHYHYKIRAAAPSGGEVEFTSQLYFDDATSAAVLRREPYSARGPSDTSNARDGFFLPEGLLVLAPNGDGFTAQFDIALDMS